MLHLRIARRADERAAWDALPGFAQVLTSLTVFSVAGTPSVAKFIAVVTVNHFAQSNHQRSFRNHVRANDVSLRSRADKRERITSHECQNWET